MTPGATRCGTIIIPISRPEFHAACQGPLARQISLRRIRDRLAVRRLYDDARFDTTSPASPDFIRRSAMRPHLRLVEAWMTIEDLPQAEARRRHNTIPAYRISYARLARPQRPEAGLWRYYFSFHTIDLPRLEPTYCDISTTPDAEDASMPTIPLYYTAIYRQLHAFNNKHH
jgi:hypothetical protein